MRTNSERVFETANVRSIESEVLRLKSTLIQRELLPERFFVPEDSSFDGIITYFTHKCGGNVADRGIVQIPTTRIRDSPNQWIE
jgi:hypothetical protein